MEEGQSNPRSVRRRDWTIIILIIQTLVLLAGVAQPFLEYLDPGPAHSAVTETHPVSSNRASPPQKVLP